jgi:hypothetical protein
MRHLITNMYLNQVTQFKDLFKKSQKVFFFIRIVNENISLFKKALWRWSISNWL